MAKKSKKQEEPKAPILTADEAWVRGHLSCVRVAPILGRSTRYIQPEEV